MTAKKQASRPTDETPSPPTSGCAHRFLGWPRCSLEVFFKVGAIC